MITFDPLQFVAVAFVACGLLAVVLELALKDPRDLLDMIQDVRAFAERPKSAGRLKHVKPHEPRVSA
ncbi:MAG TPA: hypothetical protein VJV39_17080 [Dongiaceae bacterium]|nr:hypothetical protein [Dongiaceae bacterium]